ncbi:3-keto-disaccharide hydrolase, partial [Singulisphaera rosea]
VGSSAEPECIDLSTLDGWKAPAGDWKVVGGVAPGPKNPRFLVSEPGSGILVNGPIGRTINLFSKEDFGDVEAHFEFMIPKGSNSGVKFEGLYEIQIFDSFGVKEPDLKGSDNGGVYPRAELLPIYHHIDDGHAPKTNASKPFGEWQTLDVVFRAPRFDASGKKVANAKFEKVVLNGQVVHEGLDAEYPTGNAWRLKKEMPTGPIMIQADHGPVGLRNMRARHLKEGTAR